MKSLGSMRHSVQRLGVLFSFTMLVGCAARLAPPLPAALAYPDFLYPVLPSTARASESAAVDRAWRFLQNNDLRSAEREFRGLQRRESASVAADTGVAYVALARGDREAARTGFDRAVGRAPMYVPALVGRGQALLAMNRSDDALRTFEAALAVDPSLVDLRRRVEVLRFRDVQGLVEAAGRAAAEGRSDEARQAYERAIALSPDSGFLYRELGRLERGQGDTSRALDHLRRATSLDSVDREAFVQLAELLEAQSDFDGAAAAYRHANELEPSQDLAVRLESVSAKARDARLPAEYRAIRTTAEITRGDLAALIGTRLEDLVQSAGGREQVMTDVRGHWAVPWIAQVARAGILEPFENHTFQPRAKVRRVDLASAVSRILGLVARSRPDLRARLAARPAIVDVAPAHRSYRQVADVVASGVMPLLDGARFQVSRPVSGAEAIDTIDRLRVLLVNR